MIISLWKTKALLNFSNLFSKEYEDDVEELQTVLFVNRIFGFVKDKKVAQVAMHNAEEVKYHKSKLDEKK